MGGLKMGQTPAEEHGEPRDAVEPVRSGFARSPATKLSLLVLALAIILAACQSISRPDGDLLVVSDQEGIYEIYRTNLDGSSSVNLTNNPNHDFNQVWSPDGQHIAFNSIRDGRQGIYIMQSDGTQAVRVPGTGPLDYICGWSPDGQYLLLISYRDVNAEIYALRPDGTKLTNLSRHPANERNAAWSPDGSRIAFVSDRDADTGDSAMQIYSMGVDGTNVVSLTDFPNGTRHPVWSPDGRYIAFSAKNALGRSDVYLMEADGRNARRLTKEFRSENDAPLAWSPDSTQLVVTRLDGFDTSIVTIADGVSRELPTGSPGISWRLGSDLAAAITLPTPPTEPTRPSSLALINGTLIDGTGAEPIPDAVLLIRNGRITAVGPRDEIAIPEDADVIDVQGGTILPGFINAHVHQVYSRTLSAWAQSGVTTVRSLGESVWGIYSDWNDWADQASDHDAPLLRFAHRDAVSSHPQYARLVDAGPIVSVPHGYPGSGAKLEVSSPEDARRKVTTLLDAGADVVKISLEQGERLSEDELRAIVDAAHQRGTVVSAHIGASTHLAEGLAAGIDDAAHITPDRWSNELIAQIVDQDMYLVPTLAVVQYGDGSSRCLENLRRFVEAGGKVALGDDYGVPGTQLGMPIREIELMELAGMTPMQIIVAATKNGAHVCDLATELGTLETGKMADVFVVRGDPLRDIHALTEVRLVIRDGVVIRPSQR
jgi:Tol biopolymer transport system component/imidazolonepropionase-like amidohydrolase